MPTLALPRRSSLILTAPTTRRRRKDSLGAARGARGSYVGAAALPLAFSVVLCSWRTCATRGSRSGEAGCLGVVRASGGVGLISACDELPSAEALAADAPPSDELDVLGVFASGVFASGVFASGVLASGVSAFAVSASAVSASAVSASGVFASGVAGFGAVLPATICAISAAYVSSGVSCPSSGSVNKSATLPQCRHTKFRLSAASLLRSSAGQSRAPKAPPPSVGKKLMSASRIRRMPLRKARPRSDFFGLRRHLSTIARRSEAFSLQTSGAVWRSGVVSVRRTTRAASTPGGAR
eukprot:scaffold114_cov361-Pinguiococcus_pyrenoidosus.AAC.22